MGSWGRVVGEIDPQYKCIVSIKVVLIVAAVLPAPCLQRFDTNASSSAPRAFTGSVLRRPSEYMYVALSYYVLALCGCICSSESKIVIALTKGILVMGKFDELAVISIL